MVPTKKIATEYKQKGMRKEFKHFTTKKKSQLNTKEDSTVMQGVKNKAVKCIENK